MTDILVVGGGEEKPAGEFFSTMDVLATGFLRKYGVTHVGVAGHPEGSPHFSKEVAIEALRMKKSFGERTGAHVRIVTQFGFDGEKFVRWAEAALRSGSSVQLKNTYRKIPPLRLSRFMSFHSVAQKI
ncbi:hypothetical protein [Bradyrhizobium sp. 45]|uniref:hypothetical protein n=1 Tax=Bradyrhizobium sp. 45 TaxID=1043587 RepID=UPI001FFA0A1E|nr:hypothetical protein [Bradyrhizobium sp. 45]MCK1305795.1 hypothetical protein [Bradyrhizobium sp. 45]